MRVLVDYLAELSGQSAVFYDPRYKGHHFWALAITRIMRNSDISNALISTQTLDIGFYAASSIILTDTRSHDVVARFDLANQFAE